LFVLVDWFGFVGFVLFGLFDWFSWFGLVLLVFFIGLVGLVGWSVGRSVSLSHAIVNCTFSPPAAVFSQQ
jgi:hypothetical protein